jgi:hypothetical protein
MRDSMIVYRSFFEAVKELPEKNQAQVWNAVFEYSLNFKEIELTGISKIQKRTKAKGKQSRSKQ